MRSRNVIAALGIALVAAGGGALVWHKAPMVSAIMTYFAGRDPGAQQAAMAATAAKQETGGFQLASRQLARSKRGDAAPAAPSVRTETVTYGAWTVTCRYATRKVCSAELPMELQQRNRRVNIGAWIMAHNKKGALLSVLETPQINIGVLIAKGVELKLGTGRPLKINYVACGPRRCEATLPMNRAFISELVAAADGPVSITFWKANRSSFTIKIGSIKGVDRAIAAIR